jgi:hypothetical protein
MLKSFSRLFVIYKGYRLKLIFSQVLLFISALCMIGVATLTQRLINDGIAANNIEVVLQTGIWMAVLAVIAGVTRDPQFGPLVMFGSGGVEVEGLHDVAFELAPLTRGAARRLLHETWAGKKLAGYRDIPPADQTGTLELLIRLGQMAHDLPQLAEIEINPLLVLAEGVTAVDVRARLA